MKLPKVMLLHPVGEGSTRMMNVYSAKLWLRAFVDILPHVVIEASWISYAEVAIDRERGIRDALVAAESCNGCVAVGGEFSRGVRDEWELFGQLGRTRIDLTRKPMPAILTTETYQDTQVYAIRKAITDAFLPFTLRSAA